MTTNTSSVLTQDYATGRFEANMPQRAAELRRILTGLGPSFAKASRGCSSHCGAHAVLLLGTCHREAASLESAVTEA